MVTLLNLVLPQILVVQSREGERAVSLSPIPYPVRLFLCPHPIIRPIPL